MLLLTCVYSKNTNTMALCFLKCQFTEKYKWLHETNSRSEYTIERVYLVIYAHIITFLMPWLYGTHLRNGNTQCRAKDRIASSDATFDETALVPLERRSITENNFASSDNIYKGNFCAGFPFSPSSSCPPPSSHASLNPNRKKSRTLFTGIK